MYYSKETHYSVLFQTRFPLQILILRPEKCYCLLHVYQRKSCHATCEKCDQSAKSRNRKALNLCHFCFNFSLLILINSMFHWQSMLMKFIFNVVSIVRILLILKLRFIHYLSQFQWRFMQF